jgi:hypothetical protein
MLESGNPGVKKTNKSYPLELLSHQGDAQFSKFREVRVASLRR